MRPFILSGDLLTFAPVPFDALRRGDVVLLRRADGRLCAHRVVGRGPQGTVLWIKGDAGSGRERVCDPQAVLGRLVALERRGRVRRFDTPSGRWTNFLALAASCFSWVLYPSGRLLKRGGLSLLRRAYAGFCFFPVGRRWAHVVRGRDVKVRVAAPEDVGALAGIYGLNEAQRDGLRSGVAAGEYLVADKQGQVVGALNISPLTER
ncbi:MAG: S24/S26 family peptidase, partial [Deltaproteobacteria bacterium]